MVRLELSSDEASTLRMVLQSYLSDLSMEISDTDSMDFRERLKQRQSTLRRLVDRLGS